jgi:hypothetical protein
MKGKNIKSMFLLVVLFFCVIIVAPTFADFQSQSISTFTAEATVTGGELAMSIEIRDRSDDVLVSSLTWNVAAGSGWRLADQYILLHSTLTLSGGIRIYTDNAANDANPKFGGSFGTGNGAGLIDTTTNTIVLPLAWLIKDDKGDPTTGDPWSNTSWFYFKDQSQSNFWEKGTPADKDYSTVAKAGYGIHYGQDPGEYSPAPSPNYVYIQANFTNAIGGRTYRTTTLRIELFSE